MGPILRLGAKGDTVRSWQILLHEHGLGAVCGEIDGMFGVRTDAATRQLQDRHGLMVNGVVNGATREAASHVCALPAIVAIAESQLGVKETSKNYGPKLAKYWEATSYPEGMKNREPWCAAFVAWCVREAGRVEGWLNKGETNRPRSAAVRDWVPAALKLGWKVFGPGDPVLFPAPGDIVVFKFSHVGIVTDREAYDVKTIEGNTNEHGEREGKYVLRRERAMREMCRSFIRLPKAAIGAGDGAATGRAV